jgi:hypothetical protein
MCHSQWVPTCLGIAVVLRSCICRDLVLAKQARREQASAARGRWVRLQQRRVLHHWRLVAHDEHVTRKVRLRDITRMAQGVKHRKPASPACSVLHGSITELESHNKVCC